jgi:HEPN domain-containing protein
MRDHEYWLRISEEDRTALQTLRASNGPWRIVVFLAQSAAEKSLKAFLAFKNDYPERTHDMNKLLVECATLDPTLNEFVTDCGHMSLFSVDSRYPEYEGEYDKESAMLAIASSERVCNAIRSRLPI